MCQGRHQVHRSEGGGDGQDGRQGGRQAVIINKIIIINNIINIKIIIKVAARQSAIAAGLPIIPGTDEAVNTAEEALEFVTKHGCPVILKAAYGGGGRGMRIVNHIDECVEQFERATSEALTAFGNGSMFIERY